MEAATVTRHAEKRIRKRLGLAKGSVQKMADAALVSGVRADDVSGSLRRYLDWIRHNSGSADWAAIHNGYVFMFIGTTLITCVPLPEQYKHRHVKQAMRDTAPNLATHPGQVSRDADTWGLR